MGNQLKLRFTRRAASANLCMTIGVKIERNALDEVSMAFVNGAVNWLPACLCQLFCHLILVPRKIPSCCFQAIVLMAMTRKIVPFSASLALYNEWFQPGVP